MILVGDIGGTHARFGLFENGKMVLEKRFPSAEYASLEEIIVRFLQKTKVEKACLGIAGPIWQGQCKATNLPWIIDARKIEISIGIPQVWLLNDLEASAWGISGLKKEDLYLLHQGIEQKGNKALMSAGTGLGEAGLYWDGSSHRPFATEGGHADFAPRNELEMDLWLYLKKKFGHVSYERVISGPGLFSLFEFLVETGKEKKSFEIEHNLDPAKAISESQDTGCKRAVDWFLSLYGAEAGNLALKFLSTGGFYIGGGIAPCLLERFKEGSFHKAFVDKGRFKDLLESIPIWIILNDNVALIGAHLYVSQQ